MCVCVGLGMHMCMDVCVYVYVDAYGCMPYVCACGCINLCMGKCVCVLRLSGGE